MAYLRGARGLRLGMLAMLAACEPAESADQPAAAAPPVAHASTPTDLELTCSDPVRPGDTAASLLARFGGDARTEMLGGAEGSEFSGIALWPDDPARRLEVFFAEEGPATASFVRLGEAARWRVASLALGDSLGRVREVNGRSFTFSGFGWDYGGYVGDRSGGRLQTLAGGCTLSLRLDALSPFDESLAIDGDVEISSEMPGLAAADIRLVELGIGFPTSEP